MAEEKFSSIVTHERFSTSESLILKIQAGCGVHDSRRGEHGDQAGLSLERRR